MPKVQAQRLPAAELHSAETSTRDVCATLRQRDALERADYVVRAFFSEEAFVVTRAEVPVRAFVIFVPIKSPHTAHHDDAAHPIVPVIADILKAQICPRVGAFEPDVIIKDNFR